jgi:hypothetical protein
MSSHLLNFYLRARTHTVLARFLCARCATNTHRAHETLGRAECVRQSPR